MWRHQEKLDALASRDCTICDVVPALPLIAGGLGLAQGIAGLVPTKADKRRKERIEELEAGTGMSDEEQRAAGLEYTTKIGRAEKQASQKTAGLLAATGATTGADIAAVQAPSQERIAEMRQMAEADIAKRHAAEKAKEEAELAALYAADAERKQQGVQGMFGGLSSLAGGLGASSALRGVAGATPEAAARARQMASSFQAAGLGIVSANQLAMIDANTDGGLDAALEPTVKGMMSGDTSDPNYSHRLAEWLVKMEEANPTLPPTH